MPNSLLADELSSNGHSNGVGLKQLEPAKDLSIQRRATQETAGIYQFWFSRPLDDSEIAPYWSLTRDRDLRRFCLKEGNDILQGALSSMNKWARTLSWVVEGPERVARRSQEMLSESEFGEGWSTLVSKGYFDYTTQDKGWTMEAIGAGDPDGPLEGPVLGLAHLDSQFIMPTGDVTYPIVFTNRKDNSYHKIHTSRVIRIVDMPSPNELLYGVGYCLHPDSSVLMADGSYQRIGDLVKSKSTESVMSIKEDGSFTERSITNWYTNPLSGRRLINIRGELSKLTQGSKERNSWLTEDHPILTPTGWKKAGFLVDGDSIVTGLPTPNEKQKQFLIGTLMGDGSLSVKKGKATQYRPRFSMGHAIAQSEWFNLKADVLCNDFGFSSRLYDFKMVYLGQEKINPGLSGQSNAHAGFIELRDAFYPEGKKVIPLNLIRDNLTPLMLATWYLDDGNLIDRTKERQPRKAAYRGGGYWTVEITTTGFKPEQVDSLVELLNQNGYGSFTINVNRGSKKAKSIRFLKDGAIKLFNDIAPYVPPSMRYKLPPNAPEFESALWDLGQADRLIDRVEIRTKRDKKTQTVYCIDVEGTHNFVTAGIVVHNCALSRLISTSQVLMKLARYKNEKLSDMPEAGLLILNNILPRQFEDGIANAERGRRKLGQEIWSNIMTLFSIDPAQPASANFTSFASLPDGFDEQRSVDLYVNIVALVFGVDRSEFFPASTGNFGSAQTGEISYQKAQGKGKGDYIAAIERAINWKVLPESVNFRIDNRDDEQDRLKAEINGKKVESIMSMWRSDQVANGVQPPISAIELRQMLADNVPDYFKPEFLEVDLTDNEELTDVEREMTKEFGPVVWIDSKGYKKAVKSKRMARHLEEDILAMAEKNYKAGRCSLDDLLEMRLGKVLDERSIV